MAKDKVTERSKLKTKAKALDAYLDMLTNYVGKGAQEQMVSLSEDSLQIGYENFYTNRATTCYYVISMLPPRIDKSFFGKIRNNLARVHTDSAVMCNFVITMNPHYIDWNSREMRERKRLWDEADEENRRKNPGTSYTDRSVKKIKDFNAWRQESWGYIQEAEARQQSLLDTELVVEFRIAGRSKSARKDLRAVCKEFESWSARQEIKVKKVRNTLVDFMHYTSPLTYDTSTLAAKTVPNRVISDETVAGMCTYTPGRMNDVGILMGIDLTTGLPVYKSLVRSNGEAENFIVMAETGGGKSFLVKADVVHVRLNWFHQIILDVDGEYQPLAEKLGGVVIDMSQNSGAYFDSVQISDLTGDIRIDAALYTDAILATTQVFNVLCDPINGMTSTEERLYNDAYINMLRGAGVYKEDPTTWKYSKDLTYFHIYDEICKLFTNKDYEAYEDKLRDLRDKLYPFFEPDGIRRYMFKTPIKIQDILSKRDGKPMLIDIILNLASDNDTGKRDSIEGTLKQLTATYLITLLTNYFKSLGEFTVHYIEEFQRYSNNANVASLIIYMITGNRKRNAATFIITNSPRALFLKSSITNAAIIDNINNHIIGKLKPKTIDMVVKEFGFEHSQDTLMRISTDPMYKHSFLIRINDKDTTVIKQSLPRHIRETPMFLTRNTEKTDDVEDTGDIL